MSLVDNIKDNFNKGFFNKAMIIADLDQQFTAWTIKQGDSVSVAVPFYKGEEFSEHFNSVIMRTYSDIEIAGEKYDVIMLSCDDMSLRNEFALICSQFVEPGKNGENRKLLIEHPEKWWANWKELLGNLNSEKRCYDVFGELLCVEWLLRKGEKPVWTGASSGTHDIECEKKSYEVKSTVSRYGYEVTISSVYQLKKAGETLDLFFCRLEPSVLGMSLDELADSVASLGYQKDELEKILNKKKLEKGCIARSQKYKIIEFKLYHVDDSFPSVTEASFKNGKLPDHVIKFVYTIDISGIPCINLL